jgi:hypothetical protein
VVLARRMKLPLSPTVILPSFVLKTCRLIHGVGIALQQTITKEAWCDVSAIIAVRQASIVEPR